MSRLSRLQCQANVRSISGICFALMIIALPQALAAEEPAEPPIVIAYPERVEVPEDLPSVRVLRGKPRWPDEVIVPPAMYLLAHYSGWQECLAHCRDEGLAGIAESENDFPPVQVIEPYSQEARYTGYFACANVIRELQGSGVSEQALQEACAAAYMPLGEQESGHTEEPPAPE